MHGTRRYLYTLHAYSFTSANMPASEKRVIFADIMLQYKGKIAISMFIFTE